MLVSVFRILAVVLLVSVGSVGRLAAAPSDLVTFEKVLEYVSLEVPEGKILAKLQNSPTSFVLGASQIAALKNAGASDTLIAAMQKKGAVEPAGSDVTEFVLILDCSGSMNDRLPDAASKWDAARQAATDLVNSIPAGRNLALVLYGHDTTRTCDAVEVVRSLAPLEESDKQQVATMLSTLRAVGSTPIARSLEMAGSQLERATGLARVVLLTDGMESCHGNPSTVAAQLAERFPNLKGGVDVIGFAMNANESNQVARIAAAGKGKFYNAKNANELVSTVRDLQQTISKAELTTLNLAGLSDFDKLLLEQLADPSDEIRKSAAKAVGERKLMAAVPALVKIIVSDEYGMWGREEREASLNALRILDPSKIGPAFQLAIDNSKTEIRWWGVCTLKEYPEALPSVIDNLTAGKLDGSEANKVFDAIKEHNAELYPQALVKVMRNGKGPSKAVALERMSEVK